MKKIYLFVLCFLLLINVKASDVLNEIKIEYEKNVLTTSTRSYTDERYIFKIDYLGDIANLNAEQLNFALNQSSNDYLKVFGNIKVTIIPDPNGKFKNINNKIFVGYAGGMFGNSISENVMPNNIASEKNLSFTIENPILEVYYRTNEGGAWKNDKVSLSGNLKLENQLAKLLNIDLSSNPNGVKEKYKTLYYFKPYEDKVYSNRFDFYEKTPSTTDDEENNYEVSTLKKISTEYAQLKFDYPGTGVFLEVSNNVNKLPYIIVTIILSGIGLFYILKCKKII